jgi:hypothetical protein
MSVLVTELLGTTTEIMLRFCISTRKWESEARTARLYFFHKPPNFLPRCLEDVLMSNRRSANSTHAELQLTVLTLASAGRLFGAVEFS